MSFSKGIGSKLLSLIIVVGIIFTAVKVDSTRRDLAHCFLWLANSLEPASTPAPAQPLPAPLPTAVPLAPAEMQVRSAVETYMRKNANPDCTIAFLDWSDSSTTGQIANIVLRYRVTQPSRQDEVATVRFTVQNGAVIKAELVQAPPAPAPLPPWRAAQTPLPADVDRFSASLDAAMNGPRMALQPGDAFSLAQLDQAVQKAREERKPLGFLMVWGVFFGHEADTRGSDSVSALVHFYQVFDQNLVLVFVRHETELNMVPEAVKKGFFGPDEGGYAPNMAVTDATATEFVVEIPYAHMDGPGRDQTFAAGAKKIDHWLTSHPDAIPAPL